MSSKRDRITLERLVRLLDKASSPPSDHLTHLKLQATVKHAKELLAAAQQDSASEEFYPPSTSRNALPPRDSLADLESRIAKADQRLTDSWELVSTTSRSSTPVDGGIDLDFLLPTLPPHMPIPRPPRTKSPAPDLSSTSRSEKKPRPNKAVLLNSTSIPSSSVSNDSSPRSASPPSNSYDLPAHPSDLSFTPKPTTPSGLRHRTAPPWLRNRQLKEKQKAEEQEKESLSSLSASSTTSRPPPPTSKSSALNDLLPADSSPSVTSSDLLSHHHALQSSLLSDLTSLSSALKTSTQTFSTNLEKDKEVMAEAEKRLQGNEGKIKVQGERLKGVRGKTRGTTCWTLGVLVVVAGMWVGVFLLIKVT